MMLKMEHEGVGQQRDRAEGVVGWEGGRVGDVLHYEDISSLITLGMGKGRMHMQKGPSSAEST